MEIVDAIFNFESRDNFTQDHMSENMGSGPFALTTHSPWVHSS